MSIGHLFSKETFGRDFLASLVVLLVALPLCMGIALASGVPPAIGLLSGVIGGIVVGTLAGSPLQVSGPAAGLFVLVYQIVEDKGIVGLGPIVLAAGAFQLVSGVLRFGGWFRAISPAVIQGMLAGIGLLIFASQFHVMLDHAPLSSGLQNLRYIPSALYSGIFTGPPVHRQAALVGLLTIISLFAWNVFRPKKLHAIPGPLVGVVVGTIAALIYRLPIRYISMPKEVFSSLTPVSSESLAAIATGGFWVSAVAMAVVASAESLLCATATDQMHDGPRTNYDRELMAQGVGNMVCGALGLLPITGVIVRSSANVESGARTRLSAIMHGLWLLLAILSLSWLLAMVPRAALAGILVYTGLKLMHPKNIRQLASHGRGEVLVYLITMGTIVATDLLTGVLTGLGAAAVKLLWSATHLQVDRNVEGKTVRVVVRGAATFLRLPRLARTIETIPHGLEVSVHLEVSQIDHACLEMLQNWERQYRRLGGTAEIHLDPPALPDAKAAPVVALERAREHLTTPPGKRRKAKATTG